MFELLPCLNCGHAAAAHELIDAGVYVTHDGAIVRDIRHGGCRQLDGFAECCCGGWDADLLPRVSELLGLDVRRVIIDV
jgi:hypothetical protein